MKYSNNEKEKIFNSIREDGYAVLHNFYSKEKIDKIKNSLWRMLNYVKPDDKISDLQEKYYQIKDHNPILKSHFYDLCAYEMEIHSAIHDPRLIDLAQGFYKTGTVFSGRAAIHIHDSENERSLAPHQEVHLFSADGLLLWAPLYDAKDDQGGLSVFKGSHKHGIYQHEESNEKVNHLGVSPSVYNKFEEKRLEVAAGTALLADCAVIHASVKTEKKRFARFIISERYCPLQKIPYLRKEKVPIKIPYPDGKTGVKADYNDLVD